eukprot:35642-Amorphochlora_amoeboformis.AAC.1
MWTAPREHLLNCTGLPSSSVFVSLTDSGMYKADQVTNDALIRIRKGAGGRYANIVALGKARYSLLVDTCGTVTYG